MRKISLKEMLNILFTDITEHHELHRFFIECEYEYCNFEYIDLTNNCIGLSVDNNTINFFELKEREIYIKE